MQREKKILILTDDNDYLCLSILSQEKNHSVCVEKIVQFLQKCNWSVTQRKYSDINDKIDFHHGFVLYASSEDYGLFYKDYIEDILLILRKKDNILLPGFDFFRAHHNKCYMELLRKEFKDQSLIKIKTYLFGSYMELKDFVKKGLLSYPLVVKASSGSGSSGVGIANTEKQLLKLGKKYSYRIYFDYYANLYRSAFMQKVKNEIRKIKGQKEVLYRKKRGKFIVQTFVKNLNGDYKVLVFGNKYYILRRMNRKSDFRASGSGKFSFPDLNFETEQILNYAKRVKQEINQALLSLDIAYDGKECYLIEFQCISFGPYTLQMSDKYFIQEKKEWKKIVGKSLLEEEIAIAIDSYFEENI